ncbi:class I SAM-dependent methyltransferase [soil metagenome]
MNTSAEEWSNPDKSLNYLKNADSYSHRKLGEAVLLENLPEKASRILDIGSGDGRLIKLIKENTQIKSDIEFIALDVSPTMLVALKKNFTNDLSVRAIEHNIDRPLPNLGYFDAIISSFAIHHLKHNRKYSLYEEIYDMLNPLGVFCNLEHVSSISIRQHIKFFNLIGEPLSQEEKTDKTLSVEKQLQMLRDIGFVEVDCLWKWYEMALLIGYKI